jgi:chromosome partition protein MukB
MSRARVVALALVNWKGVFYERYLLDRHVTALEGANGAGKTTVMIAAYVALLPDMTRLRFTNLGESGATGGDRGIWGRLGDPGRPSYTVIELALDGDERVLMGVRLTRTTEPTVEPTAFLVTGLSPAVRLSDILLARRDDGDHVPELDELKATVARSGGQIEVFRTTKDYFAALFDRGITPMRLTSEEERGKLNEMLRTSMTGGISRALTSELRDFLLKEETGLADTLSRMRGNLEACRRTRGEVAEARLLEGEIRAIYDAGLAMFGAAVGAAREGAAEAMRRVDEAQRVIDGASRAQRELDDEVARFSAVSADLEARLAAARAELQHAVAERERRAAARKIVAGLADLDRELDVLTEAERRARSEQASATAARAAAAQERTRALEAYDRAAVGLAHLQAGLDELVRRAHGHRQLARSLAEARALLQRPELSADEAASVIEELETERHRLEVERARLQSDVRDVHARRAEHARASEALGALAGVDERDPHERARSVLARLADREAALARMPDLDRELAEAARFAPRQRAARALVAELGLDGEPGSVPRALAAVEQQLRDDAVAGEVARTSMAAARHQLEGLRAQLGALGERQARWDAATAAVERLAALGPAPATRAELSALRERLTAEHLALAARRAQLDTACEEAQRRAVAIERSGTNLDPELLRLCEELGGELVASRFEDLDGDAASWVEARLGPLAGALIVDDVDAAARALAGMERIAPTVWLVAAGTRLAIEAPADIEKVANVPDVVSPEPFGLRITRRAARPSLGRRAREREIRELYAAIDRDGAALDELAGRALLVAGWRRDVDALEAHLDAWLAGDPAGERARLESEMNRLELADDALRETERDAEARSAQARARLDGLRRLLGEVALLEPPDHAERARELAGRRAELEVARAELLRLAGPRQILAEHLEALRRPPPDDAALADHDRRADALGERLDGIARIRAALEHVLAHRHAAAWGDAQGALDAQAGLAPALEAQHAAARTAMHAADAAAAAAEAAWETAVAATQHATARVAAAAANRQRLAGELAALGGVTIDADEASEEEALAALAAAVGQLDDDTRALITRRALAAERLERAVDAVSQARTRLAAETRGAGPAVAAWTELRGLAETAGLREASAAGLASAGRSSIQLTADARSQREILLDRLGRARGGDDVVAAIRALTLDGPGYLRAWSAAREWLGRRVPVHVAEGDDPMRALERLSDHLVVLEGRLARQEADLRGASEDVARGIDVQLRRAGAQVRRLNQQLEGIRFGSIQGIRVEIRRVARMEQILRALRKGEAQELLFSSAMPIEEALDEIFRRYGGGGRSGGQRLLDYREYVELGVEIRRHTTGAEWEAASPTRLSTGEAIGVGAALMMVVLTEWERDASLLRARRAGGSLRFLFLDEANRLSRDNLGVLFDLCRSLDLQLLIAAPEVARAEGNTTYRLVRHVTDDGREEVIVSGRRAIGAPEPTAVGEPETPSRSS